LHRKLQHRQTLAIDPARSCAIKRGVHELEIDTSAERFAPALRQVMRDPEGAFGLIDVKRAPDRLGSDFIVGERFHGCVRLARLRSPGLRLLGKTRLGAWLEDSVLSDYAEVIEVEPYKVVYRYLSGTPIAGTSTFLIEPLGESRCRFRVVFEYQELGGLAISALHRFGLRMHDQCTWVQAHRAAALCGAHVVSSTIPHSYGAD
jgi:hypothetical protein